MKRNLSIEDCQTTSVLFPVHVVVCINPHEPIAYPLQGTQPGIEPGALPPEDAREIPPDRVDECRDDEYEDPILQHGIYIHWLITLASCIKREMQFQHIDPGLSQEP